MKQTRYLCLFLEQNRSSTNECFGGAVAVGGGGAEAASEDEKKEEPEEESHDDWAFLTRKDLSAEGMLIS